MASFLVVPSHHVMMKPTRFHSQVTHISAWCANTTFIEEFNLPMPSSVNVGKYNESKNHKLWN